MCEGYDAYVKRNGLGEMRVATWTAAVVVGGGLAVLAVYWVVTVLTALFDSGAPLPVKIAVPSVLAGGIALLAVAVLQRIRDRKEEDLEGVEY